MNIQQLEYIVSLFKTGNFSEAADACCVTQATLSSMIKKAEEDLGAVLFDRSKHPILPTLIGKKVIEQAQVVLKEKNKMYELVKNNKKEITGKLTIGIIPTLSTYLLPMFLIPFQNKYPQIDLSIKEILTHNISKELKDDIIDVAIASIPLSNALLKETHLFYEELILFAGVNNASLHFDLANVETIDYTNHFFLQGEGHCLANQVYQFCKIEEKRKKGLKMRLQYELTSIETLKRLVNKYEGSAIIPELSTLDMNKDDQKRLRHFKSPVPVRQIGLITYQHFIKNRFIGALRDCIVDNLPLRLFEDSKDKDRKVIEVL